MTTTNPLAYIAFLPNSGPLMAAHDRAAELASTERTNKQDRELSRLVRETEATIAETYRVVDIQATKNAAERV